MPEEKARKQRLHPLPKILEGLVAPHPDLLGQLGGQGCWASLWEAKTSAAQAEALPAQAASCLRALHIWLGRPCEASRQRLAVHPTLPTAHWVPPKQPLIKGLEPDGLETP